MTGIYIGVDVGAGGGIATIDEHGVVLRVVSMPRTDREILDEVSWAAINAPLTPRRAVIEAVHSSPQMGVKSAFSFGGSYGALRMALTAACTPFDAVTPFRWQRRMQCLSGGDKRVTKERAQQLFPDVKVTHAVADALLLAEYCRLTQPAEEP